MRQKSFLFPFSFSDPTGRRVSASFATLVMRSVYNTVNGLYTSYNWIVNRQTYDIEGINIGRQAAEKNAVLTVGTTAMGAIGPELMAMRNAFIYKGIGSAGKIGESALSKLGGKPQAYFPTSQGGRYIDRLVNGIAHESKVGYTSLTSMIKLQVMKDVELIQKQDINGAVWHFYKSPITGQGTPSGPLQNLLKENGIDFIIHD
jgi:hypothetical protein